MRITGPVLKILREFVNSGGSDLYGLEILRSTGLKSGTVYPILERLESQGWVSSHWEDVEPSKKKRPRRRLYSVTSAGLCEIPRVLYEYSPAPPSQEGFAGKPPGWWGGEAWI